MSDARQADLAASAQIEPDFDQKDLLEGVQDLSGRMPRERSSLNACNFESGARETAQSITSWLAMNCGAIEGVRDHRAGGTACLEAGPEYEVIDEKLRASAEEVFERGAASSVSKRYFLSITGRRCRSLT